MILGWTHGEYLGVDKFLQPGYSRGCKCFGCSFLWQSLVPQQRGFKPLFQSWCKISLSRSYAAYPACSFWEYHQCNDHNLEKCMVASTSWQKASCWYLYRLTQTSWYWLLSGPLGPFSHSVKNAAVSSNIFPWTPWNFPWILRLCHDCDINSPVSNDDRYAL